MRSVAGNVIAILHTVTSITISANICKLKEWQSLRPLSYGTELASLCSTKFGGY